MAFGFGFNKQKVLSAAEKCVQQGKLPNAIAEYEKILKHDAKDLTVMNTIGDLYSRLGESEKAADCFKSVGDAYASQGFTVKAIAMYKKLSKLKASMESILRLAELYTQQGLFNDARAQYLLVAEDFLKSGQLDQAVRIFEKTLEMDPDNAAMRTKLAEVYVQLGKKEDAWKILSAAAESLRSKGQLAAADEVLQRMLKLQPGSSYVLVLRGRAALDGGDANTAIESLSKVADLDTNPDGLRALFQAYLKTKRFDDASALATKLATVHNDGTAIREYAEALLENQEYRDALNVYNEHADELLKSDPAKFSESLRTIIGHVREDSEALEILLALFQKTGENTHVSELYELLAHAYVQSGNLEKARECYAKLMQIEPANQMHARNHQQVLEKMGQGDAPRQITSEEGSARIEELEATAPFIEQHYPDDVALAVRSALTDAELFMSYNSANKALEPLLTALPKAPRDLRLNQKLAALHTKAGRFTEAGVCCRTLESIYHDAGRNEEATRYADLAAKYEERSGGSVKVPQSEAAAAPTAQAPVPDPAAEFEISAPASESFNASEEATATSAPVPTQKAAPRSGLFFHGATKPTRVEAKPAEEMAAPAPAPAKEPTGEVDLSGEWESELSVEAPQTEPVEAEIPREMAEAEVLAEAGAVDDSVASADVGPAPQSERPAKPDLSEGIEEVRFYLGQGMTEHAQRVLAKLEEQAPGSPELAVLRLGIDSATQQLAAEAPEPEVALIDDSPVEEPASEQSPLQAAATPQPWPKEPPQKPAERPVLQDMVAELEAAVGDGFMPQEEADISAPEAPAVVEPAPEPQPVEQFRSGSLDEFVSDLEASLGNDFLADAADNGQSNAVAREGVQQAPAAHAEAPVAETATAARAAAASASTSAPSSIQATPPLATSASTVNAGVDLADMFGELKHELEEETAASDEDPETHYNLGVAFREMGLLDEAIGEFQKVCQSAERGRAFPQIMQTYTWLAQCFLDKGVPEAAIRWYEQALKLPNLDQETRTALHYELGSSFETAGNKPSALNNFLQVYGSNIDYRDVAERIKALRP